MTPEHHKEQESGLFWLQHCGNWFGFAEPVQFTQHKDGGFFASVATGEQVFSSVRNGYRNPERGIAPWAARPEKTTDSQAIDPQGLSDTKGVVIQAGGEQLSSILPVAPATESR